jgi:FkbM family methyltransferase
MRFSDPGRDFLDIGAHIGYYSSYAAPLVRKVYCFEPDERNLDALRTNAALAGNVVVIPRAVSSACGAALLYLGRGSSVSSLESSVGGMTREVTITTVDSFAASCDELDVCLVKTDVEGHDLEALRGMRSTVARCRPLILTECKGTSDLMALCSEWGYRMYGIVRDRRTTRAQLLRMGPVELRDCWYKMLFLVPGHLVASFESLVAVDPSK